jgi:hypothetical protein
MSFWKLEDGTGVARLKLSFIGGQSSLSKITLHSHKNSEKTSSLLKAQWEKFSSQSSVGGVSIRALLKNNWGGEAAEEVGTA